MNADLKNLYKYFTENKLVINLKKNKTESMLFGTAKRLSSCPDELDLRYHDTKIISTTTYTYLGTTLDKTLNMGENFRVTYRKLSSKLLLLSSLKPCLTKKSLGMIYQGIILPTVLFNCIVNLNYSNTQVTMLESIDCRVQKILGEKRPSTLNEIHKHAVLLVKKCMLGVTNEHFSDYFTLKVHDKPTRNNGALLCIPKVKLKLAKSGFFQWV